MTKAQLVKWSAARDVLDFFVIGQIPPFNWLLDLPILIMHFWYAGPNAVVTLLELIPVVGMMPIFTLAALFYPKPGEREATAAQTPDNARPTAVMHLAALPAPTNSPQQPLYALIDGRLVPVELTSGAGDQQVSPATRSVQSITVRDLRPDA